MNSDLIAKAKSYGFSDKQIAHLTGRSEDEIRAWRKEKGLLPSYRLVDTCAAEFEAYTPYFYSTYDRGDDEIRPSEKRKVMILGGGPNRIGQGIEFDYCCVHASYALKEEGIETLMVNSNPETVSTDYDTSDKLFFEPLTLEDVLHITSASNAGDCPVGANTSQSGHRPSGKWGEYYRDFPDSIEMAEDQLFAVLPNENSQPANGLAVNEEEKLGFQIGLPGLVRPSFVLGAGHAIVYSDAELRRICALRWKPRLSVRCLLMNLEHATEVDVDCICDAIAVSHPEEATIVIGGMLEHKFAGVHSGDAAMVSPHTLSESVIQTFRNTLTPWHGSSGCRG